MNKLFDELEIIASRYLGLNYIGSKDDFIKDTAAFIFQDRRRIIAPAEEAIRFWTNVGNRHCEDEKMINELVYGLEQTIKNAGVSDET